MYRARGRFSRFGRVKRVRHRRVRRALNLMAVLLSLWWVKADPHLPVRSRDARARLAEWIELSQAPRLLDDLLEGCGWRRETDETELVTAADSSQRVLWPEEWSDPQLSVVAPPPEPSDSDGEGRGEAVEVLPKPKPARREWFIVTAYCPCGKCCGRWARYHRTAAGLPLSYNGGRLVAADTRVLPFHTKVRVPGYARGRPVPVVDRGSAVRGRMLDVFFASHWRAEQWGKKRLLVEIAP